MLLYRIIFAKYADSKFASGDSGRWNKDGERVLYTSTSPALAMSEIMAHRLGQGYLTAGYSLITFEIPDSVDYKVIERSQLPENWRLFSSYSFSQPLGSAWFQQRQTLSLRVPSAVVPGDTNVVINTTNCFRKKAGKHFPSMSASFEPTRKSKPVESKRSPPGSLNSN